MKLKLFLILSLLPTLALANKDIAEKLAIIFAEPDAQQIIAIQDSGAWHSQFITYLTRHENPNIAIYGLLKVMSYKSEGETKQSIIELGFELLNESNLSPQALMILEVFCFESGYKGVCEEDLFNEKVTETAGENLILQLRFLNQAIENNNTVEIEQSLEKLAKAQFSNEYSFLSQEFIQTTKEYMDNHPLPDNVLKNEVDVMVKLSNYSEDSQQGFAENPEDLFLVTTLMNYKLLLPIPRFRNLIDLCQTQADYSKSCLKIAEILIQQNSSYLNVRVGQSIKVKTLELQGSESALETARQEQAVYEKQMGCIQAAIKENDEYNFKHFNSLETTLREKGEVEMHKKWARLNYQYQLKKGNLNALNPINCSL